MNAADALATARAELDAGMALTKCRQCGCMREAIESLRDPASGPPELAAHAVTWLGQLAPTRYACLGCAHCFPAVALNALAEAGLVGDAGLACAFEVADQRWPVVAGEYAAFCDGPACPVAVSTLASVDLADELARRRPAGLCIVGKTETENIGIDKVVKNVVANSTIRYLIVAGRDPAGHRSGQTLLALANNGVAERMRVVGSVGKRPVLRNVTRDEVAVFRAQVRAIDLIGCEDADRIAVTIGDLAAAVPTAESGTCDCGGACAIDAKPHVAVPEVVVAQPPERVEMDRAGYFVIVPDTGRGVIVVEHYAYDNRLQHVIEGADARSLYWTIIERSLVTLLSHAAYLGKELARAELALQHGWRYVQDGA
jgi:tetrahydromethanopterin S-methyltransferase subunit A